MLRLNTLLSNEFYTTAIKVNSMSAIKAKIKISGRADDVVGIFRKTIFIGSPKEKVFPQNSSKLRPFTPQAKQTRCTACKKKCNVQTVARNFPFFHIFFSLCVRTVLNLKIKKWEMQWKEETSPTECELSSKLY